MKIVWNLVKNNICHPRCLERNVNFIFLYEKVNWFSLVSHICWHGAVARSMAPPGPTGPSFSFSYSWTRYMLGFCCRTPVSSKWETWRWWESDPGSSTPSWALACPCSPPLHTHHHFLATFPTGFRLQHQMQRYSLMETVQTAFTIACGQIYITNPFLW